MGTWNPEHVDPALRAAEARRLIASTPEAEAEARFDAVMAEMKRRAEASERDPDQACPECAEKISDLNADRAKLQEIANNAARDLTVARSAADGWRARANDLAKESAHTQDIVCRVRRERDDALGKNKEMAEIALRFLAKRYSEVASVRSAAQKYAEEAFERGKKYGLDLACPECAEKDAEIARLKAVLERIGRPHDCGCWQKCHCDSQAELMIWKEEAKSAANEALGLERGR